eukprot:TRINITY_DN1338_c0_g1_i1.p1 TRINITY_DN1338_c0_g1~~TRINITY_DN1338_c0_g1_i1.p1  ORF type:complete len:137 (-),score=32.94 TRINITY_DN1338_c0_g1_i1:90-476(-)
MSLSLDFKPEPGTGANDELIRTLSQRSGNTDRYGAVHIELQLPDGELYATTYSLGEQVQTIKRFLHDEKDYEYDTTSLYLGELFLMDPLSLNDIEEIVAKQASGESVLITVQGEKREDSVSSEDEESV